MSSSGFAARAQSAGNRHNDNTSRPGGGSKRNGDEHTREGKAEAYKKKFRISTLLRTTVLLRVIHHRNSIEENYTE